MNQTNSCDRSYGLEFDDLIKGPCMSEPLDEEEFATLIRLAKRVLWSDPDTRRKIQAHKLNITPANFYAKIPSVERPG